MTQSISQTSSDAHGGHVSREAGAEGLPNVMSSLSGVELVGALESAARRGKLPGFQRGQGDIAFELTDFGTPFESVLSARTRPMASGSAVEFTIRMKSRMPWVYAIVLVATVWPGVWLTDSMLRTYSTTIAGLHWGWTWGGYLVLTVPFVPLAMWQALRKSRQTGREEAGTLVEKVRKLVGNVAA